jgi:hypothetical protein
VFVSSTAVNEYKTATAQSEDMVSGGVCVNCLGSWVIRVPHRDATF